MTRQMDSSLFAFLPSFIFRCCCTFHSRNITFIFLSYIFNHSNTRHLSYLCSHPSSSPFPSRFGILSLISFCLNLMLFRQFAQNFYCAQCPLEKKSGILLHFSDEYEFVPVFFLLSCFFTIKYERSSSHAKPNYYGIIQLNPTTISFSLIFLFLNNDAEIFIYGRNHI